MAHWRSHFPSKYLQAADLDVPLVGNKNGEGPARRGTRARR